MYKQWWEAIEKPLLQTCPASALFSFCFCTSPSLLSRDLLPTLFSAFKVTPGEGFPLSGENSPSCGPYTESSPDTLQDLQLVDGKIQDLVMKDILATPLSKTSPGGHPCDEHTLQFLKVP